MAKTVNKIKRQELHHKRKRTKENEKRDMHFTRRREEDKRPELRVQRRTRNQPVTIDSKRTWDVADLEEGDGLGLAVDVAGLKRRKTDADEQAESAEGALTEMNLKKVPVALGDRLDDGLEDDMEDDNEDRKSQEDDLASLMDESSDGEETEGKDASAMRPPPIPSDRAPSPPASTTSTSISHIPDALAAKYPTLFRPPSQPKILITTEQFSTLHEEAELLTRLFPNSTYIPRSSHRYRKHHFSLREIAKFAQKREYTTMIVLGEDNKNPTKLMFIHLPHASQLGPETKDADSDEEADANGEGETEGESNADTDGEADPSPEAEQHTDTDASPNSPDLPKPGPTFHFSLKNFIPGSRLPGHGNPTIHHPELILNNFRTPLGLLTASLFRTLFPPAPEVQGRQVVTLHNQRDYIFVRRHRYVFRERKGTERQVVDSSGAAMKGAEDIKAGLQELGPRFTLKLRRVEGGIHRAAKSEWEWKARMEKTRTKFQM